MRKILVEIINNASKYLAFKDEKYLRNPLYYLEALKKILGIESLPKNISREIEEKFKVHNVKEGYDRWFEYYNEKSSLIEIEEKIVKEILPKVKGKKVLDAGCGNSL